MGTQCPPVVTTVLPNFPRFPVPFLGLPCDPTQKLHGEGLIPRSVAPAHPQDQSSEAQRRGGVTSQKLNHKLLFVSASSIGLLVLSSSCSQGMCFPDFWDRSLEELRGFKGKENKSEEYSDASHVVSA